MSGTGTMNKSGAGYIDFHGANPISGFNGLFNVVCGTLAVNNGNQGSGIATLNIATGAALDVRTGTFIVDGLNGGGTVQSSSTGTLSIGNNNGSGLFSGVLQDSGAVLSFTKNGTGTETLTGSSNTYSGSTTISGGTLQIGNGGTSGSLGQGAIADNANLVFNLSGSTTFSNPQISGSGNVTQAGTGTVTLNNAQNDLYTGNTTVSEGTLVEKSGVGGTWTRTSGNTMIASGATLRLDFSAETSGHVSNYLSNISVGSGGTLDLYGTTTVIDVVLLDTGVVSGTGTMNKTGAGYIDFHGVNSISGFNGLFNVVCGTLAVNNGNQGSGIATLNIATGAALDVRTGTFIVDGLNGGGTVQSSSTGTLSIGNNNGSGLFSGVLQDSGAVLSFTKNGTGTETLTGSSNTYSGSTTISGGTLQIGNGGTSGSLGQGAIADNANLVFNLSGSTTFSNPQISGSGNVTQAGTGTVTLNNAQNDLYTGNTTVSEGTLVEKSGVGGTWTRTSGNTMIASGATLRLDFSAETSGHVSNYLSNISVGSGGTLDLYGTTTVIDVVLLDTGVVSGTGTMNKTGAGYIDFHGVNSISGFNGLFNVVCGTLAVNNGNQGSGIATLNIATGAALDVRTGTFIVDGLNGGGTVQSSSTGTLSIGNNNGSGLFSGVLQDSGAVLSFTKNGTGTETLTGSNTYSGNTNISGGTLQIWNGTGSNISAGLSPNSTYNISSGATLFLDYGGLSGANYSFWSQIRGAGNLSLYSNGTGGTGGTGGTEWAYPNLASGFTGNLILQQGRLDMSSPSQLGGASTFFISNGAQLLSFGGTHSQSFVLNGTGWGRWANRVQSG
ncbi:beta strand repeat-containing protein [Cupriavidus sp. D39]|uniref:beta strand repeat-containing protein n=1 Tax=Cupriavidus sp. D39 TaxID=2997877 RepID=UPI00226DDBA3|nr:autotransporter-associated beta strand repeat-containing protein [Cupriavidus sp. D39]MCY0858734.1 autotransporter-associated beta strand repeat-containing protein [Cupriavidus sp. D39]